MAIILRYVASNGILTERFFAINSVSDTTSETLKKAICDVLLQYNLQVGKLRGQGYDGASNMSGKFNGLQALFLKECPYAYFVHFFAHRLQLTLMAAAKQCKPIWKFFSMLDLVINIVRSSPKRNTELLEAHRKDLDEMIEQGELETGRGANQMTSLQHSGTTRWGSHFALVVSMINMFSATCEVLEHISEKGSNTQSQVEAEGALESITTFQFVFSMHLMKAIMNLTTILCEVFQKESVDILSALGLVSATKTRLQKLRDEGWEPLIQEVTFFCSKHEVKIPDFKEKVGRGKNTMTFEHLYHFENFNQSIDYQLSELNSRFSDSSMKLLQLSVALDPTNSFRSVNAHDIYQLATEFYPQDFKEYELLHLSSKLQIYEAHMVLSPYFQVFSLAKLLKELVERKFDSHYPTICRLIRLVPTLPVSTATTERAFSAIKLVKTDIRNKMADEFLADSLMLFIERDYATKLDVDSIINEFAKIKYRRVQLTF